MSPIKGLTDQRRLPRLGKIHLGIKVESKNKKGVMYPKATDYFVVPEEVAKVVGEKPVELPILFPLEDDEKFAAQYYKSYSMTRGLVCRGDGETCRRMVDVKTGEMANRDSTDIEWKDDLPCAGKDCPYYGKQCKEVMNLQFLMPTVEGLGVWQIDTSSINSIRNINSAVELIRGVFGRIAMIPLLLTLEPIEIVNPDDGKKKTVRCLNLRTKGTLLEVMKLADKPISERLLPAPSDIEAPDDMEPPELIMPQNQEPKEQQKPDVKQAEKDTEELWPKDSTETPETTQDTQQPTERHINPDWLTTSLQTLVMTKPEVWNVKNILSFMLKSYKVEGKTVLEAAGKLDAGKAKHFCKHIEDALK